MDTRRLNLTSLFLFSLINIAPASVFAINRDHPGELVNIGTHQLHIYCLGQGSPSVIIDSGIGGFSLEWAEIQNRLSKDVRVCSYDRAGYGWSESGPEPRTTENISRELRRLLEKADIPGPYVLIGHSFGGYNVRYFASKYPELVAGMVLIDAAHPEQFNTQEFKRVEYFRKKPRYKNSIRVSMFHPIISDRYPDENRRKALVLMSTLKFKNTLLNELDYMEVSARQVSRKTNHPPYLFPVTILTRGKRLWPYDDLGERREQQWLRLQNDMQKISLQSRHYLAGQSGHIIHLDQPDFVIENIMATIIEARKQAYDYIQTEKSGGGVPLLPAASRENAEIRSFLYGMVTSKPNLIMEKSIHQATLDNQSRRFGNRLIYFFQAREQYHE